jgi:hypothetical protein
VEQMKAVPPVLLERVCDAGRSSMTAEEILRQSAEVAQQRGEAFMLAHPYFPGCGTRFQWYLGSGSQCPECGLLYVTDINDYKSGKYAVKE